MAEDEEIEVANHVSSVRKAVLYYRKFSIPDSRFKSASKNLSFLTQKTVFKALRKMIMDVHPGSELVTLVADLELPASGTAL
jgi:hypothetical protein